MTLIDFDFEEQERLVSDNSGPVSSGKMNLTK